MLAVGGVEDLPQLLTSAGAAFNTYGGHPTGTGASVAPAIAWQMTHAQPAGPAFPAAGNLSDAFMFVLVLRSIIASDCANHLSHCHAHTSCMTFREACSLSFQITTVSMP